MREGLSIGEFAAVTHLSVRMLRRYHEAGLLEPERVDPATGYRFYASSQIPSAQVIHRLRELDMPLAEVKAILAADDPGRRTELVAGHLRRLEESLDRTRAAVVSLRELIEPTAGELAVELRTVQPRLVAAVEDHVERSRILDWYASAMDELDGVVARDDRAGPPGGQYANELFAADEGDVRVYYPVRRAHDAGRVRTVELPAVELAVTVHAGAHDDIDVTYGRLGAWVADHAMAVDGPVHETYLVGPRDSGNPRQWQTEVGWPVFRLGAR